jgi:hypothetical protein
MRIQAEEGLQSVADREKRMEERARKAREQAEKAIKSRSRKRNGLSGFGL